MFGKQYVIEGIVWMRQEGGWELIGRQLVKEKKAELEIYPLINLCQEDFSRKAGPRDTLKFYCNYLKLLSLGRRKKK